MRMRELPESGAPGPASGWRSSGGSSMRRARSVTGPLRRAHPASGATWNVQVVRGKMSSQCLWHACRALSAGLLLMLLGAAMAVIGYYADFLSVDQEIRGNATISVKDEARGFHLNNLSYVGPIVMGFGGFIVVAACVMTFEARDSAAKVTPARPTALPRPLPRRGPPCAPARLDQLGVYRLPHVLPLPHSLPLVPMHRHRPVQVSASAAESECGSQSSLALDLHASGACAGVTLRVRDNTRRRPLARQQRLRDDTILATPRGSSANINNEEAAKTPGQESNATIHTTRLSVESELRASSAPPATRPSSLPSPLASPSLTKITPLDPEHTHTCIFIEEHATERQTDALRGKTEEDVLPREVVLDIDEEELAELHENMDRIAEEEMDRQPELQIMVATAQQEEGDDGADEDNVDVVDGQEEKNADDDEDNARALDRLLSEEVEVTGYPSLFDLNTRDEFTLERLQEELNIDIASRLSFDYHSDINIINMYKKQKEERLFEEVMGSKYGEATETQFEGAVGRNYGDATESQFAEAIGRQFREVTARQFEEAMPRRNEETEKRFDEATRTQFGDVIRKNYAELTERQSGEVTERQSDVATEGQCEDVTQRRSEEATESQTESVKKT